LQIFPLLLNTVRDNQNEALSGKMQGLQKEIVILKQQVQKNQNDIDTLQAKLAELNAAVSAGNATKALNQQKSTWETELLSQQKKLDV
jgi:predicted  nucleic acid-binding Zn-ribbon protein